MQHTLRAPLTCQGVGVHSGEVSRVTVRPAEAGTGLRMVRSDAVGAEPGPVHVDAFASLIGDIATQVEHLLAALVASGVDNALIEVEGGEIPVLDGSAAPWMALLEEAGLVGLPARRRVIVVREPVEVRSGDRVARLLPAPRLTVSAQIAFPHPRIGRQALEVSLDAETFSRELAWARTFSLLEGVEALRAAGFARGGSLENALVYGEEDVLNPEGARAPDEPVRHKLLDMVGDVALAGMPLCARFEAELPGHALSAALLRALFARPDAYRVEEADLNA